MDYTTTFLNHIASRKLAKQYKFTDVIVYVTNKLGKLTIRTSPNAIPLPKGIYFLHLPNFGIIYLGISSVTTTNKREGTNSRFFQHAQKITGIFKSARDTKEWKNFREDAFLKGYAPETILNHVTIYFMPMENKSDFEVDGFETLFYNAFANRNECRCNKSKKTKMFNSELFDSLMLLHILPKNEV